MRWKLPQIPEGSTPINDIVSVTSENGTWTYYIYLWPLYIHQSSQRDHFRYIASSLINAGLCRQKEIVSVFGVDRKLLSRANKQLKERGAESFFQKRVGRTGGRVLTAPKLAHAQKLFNQGCSREEVSAELGVKKDTLRKALMDGRLSEGALVTQASTGSERTEVDAKAADGMGVACTDIVERVGAALGWVDGVESRFEKCLDVPMGGVLCALPALLENGLLAHKDKLGTIHGYYTAVHILLVLVFMLLCRIKTVEQLRGYAPGEMGKLLGLDRIPEARCLRQKMDALAGDTHADQWSCALSQQWLNQSEDDVGLLYIDGHVKVYGGNIELPRRFVSRERLCLRGISFYWVNDALGQPFFVVEKQIDAGLISVLKNDIIARLIDEVPNQPSKEELEQDPWLHRFVIVFDREGYSPKFFQEIWEQHRIACLTYKKNCTDKWPEAEFEPTETISPNGECIEMQIAERGTYLGKETVLVKEVRKLSNSGHQTAIISTAKKLEAARMAPAMFARWSQENFFAYAMHHFNIDGLTSHRRETFNGTETVVNPQWRQIDNQQRRLRTERTQARAKYVAMDTQKRAEPTHKHHTHWQLAKAQLLEQIQNCDQQLHTLKEEKRSVQHYVCLEELPQESQFAKLASSRRTLLNTIGMIAYRSETAMALMLKASSINLTDARTLLQDLFTTAADIIPDEKNKILNVHVHSAATPVNNRRIQELLNELNKNHTIYPNTELKMIFHSKAQTNNYGSSEIP